MRFRLRAAWYVLRLTRLPRLPDILTYVTTLAVPALTLRLLWNLNPFVPWFAVALLMAAALVLLVWWHSHLPRIFGRAATNDKHALTLRLALRYGLENEDAYRQINMLYQDAVTQTNEFIAATGSRDHLGFVATGNGVCSPASRSRWRSRTRWSRCCRVGRRSAREPGGAPSTASPSSARS